MSSLCTSEVDTLLKCPQKYNYKHVLGLKGDSFEWLNFKYFVVRQMVSLLLTEPSTLLSSEGKGEYELVELPFWRNIFSMVKDEWFVFDKEKDQEVNKLKDEIIRYLSYERSLKRKIVSCGYVSLQRKGDLVFRTSVDVIAENADGSFEAIKFVLEEPELTSNARKSENLPESSFDLAVMYLTLSERCNNKLKVSYYHLKNKDDKVDVFVEPFNNKANKNIVTAEFTKESAESVVSAVENLVKENLGVSKPCYSSDCDSCIYKAICSKDYAINQEICTVLNNISSTSKKKELNDSQKLAVNSLDGHLAIIAPPGSGKTACIEERTQMLMKRDKNTPILILSFSNKAVGELNSRLCDWFSMLNLEIKTINGFCFEILKQCIYSLSDCNHLIGPLKVLTGASRKKWIELILKNLILSEDEKEKLKSINELKWLDEILKVPSELYSGVSFVYPRGTYGVINKVDTLVEKLLDGKNVELQSPIELLADVVAKVLRVAMKEFNYITFNDQGRLLLQIAKEYPEEFERIMADYKDSYIMIDEYQDCDDTQHSIIKEIGCFCKNICICADDDQRIYSFRNNSSCSVVDDFIKNFNAETVILDTNYRSGSDIVELGKRFIRNNVNRIDKDFHSVDINGRGNVWFADNQNATVSSCIEKVRSSSGYSYYDFTVIARKWGTLRKVYTELQNNNIPVVFSTTYLVDRVDFQELYSLLKVLTYKGTDIDLYILKDYDLSSWNAENFDQIRTETQFSLQLEQLLKKVGMVLPLELSLYLRSVISSNGILKLEELYIYFSDIIIYGEKVVIEDLREYNAVKLITDHSAKGKEFKAVILPNINEFGSKEEDKESELDEERRLLYVAITRAKEYFVALCPSFKKESPLTSEFVEAVRPINRWEVKVEDDYLCIR